MMQIVLVGLGAGAAAALLFASVASGSMAAIFLFYLAPLPILIAALGWSHWAGLIAAASATAVIGSPVRLFFIAVPVIAFGAWWLGYLALLARPATNGGGTELEWYPVGRLVLWAAMIGTADRRRRRSRISAPTRKACRPACARPTSASCATSR